MSGRENVESLNSYGDSLIPTTGAHGSDISSQRMDGLDNRCLSKVLDLRVEELYGVRRGTACVDLGCGLGAMGARMAALGAQTTLIDLAGPGESLKNLQSSLPGPGSLSYLKKDGRELLVEDLPPRIDLLYSQRFIHYLTFCEARRLLSTFAEAMPDGAMVYISASGMASELGNGYEGASRLVGDRYGPLAPAMAQKHSIHESVCLYTRGELAGLVEGAGFVLVEIWSDDFGNVQGIFERAR